MVFACKPVSTKLSVAPVRLTTKLLLLRVSVYPTTPTLSDAGDQWTVTESLLTVSVDIAPEKTGLKVSTTAVGTVALMPVPGGFTALGLSLLDPPPAPPQAVRKMPNTGNSRWMQRMVIRPLKKFDANNLILDIAIIFELCATSQIFRC